MRIAKHARGGVLLGILTAFVGAGSVHGQGWTAEASAGGAIHDPVAADVGTRSAILGVRHEGPRWFYLSAGTPLDSAGLPWGAAGLGGRVLLGGGSLALGADLAAHAHGYRERTLGVTGGGATLEALPFLALSRGAARVELRSGMLHHTSVFDSQTTSRTVHDNGIRLVLAPDARLALTGEGRYVRAEEGEYPYAGVGAELSQAWGTVWGYAGRWMSDAITTPAWGAGASVELGGRVALNASLEQLTNDPLYWNAPRQSWSIGVSRTFGGIAPPPAPLPVLPEIAAGRVTLRIPLDAAEGVPSVAGDFTGWNPVPMVRSGDAWTATLPVGPGVYRYAFRAADGNWFVPESVPGRTDDGFGGVSAVLIVP